MAGAAGPASPAVVARYFLCMFAAFGIGGFSQEYLIHTLQWKHPLLLALSVPLLSMSMGILRGGLNARRAPLRAHVAVGLCSCIALGLSNIAPAHMSYPMFLVAKAARLPFVMLVAAVWLRRRYKRADVLGAAIVIFGLSLTLIGGHGQHSDKGKGSDRHDDAAHGTGEASVGISAYGCFVMAFALLFDGLTANAQEALFQQFGPSSHEMQAFGNAASTIGLLVGGSMLKEGALAGGIAAASADWHAAAVVAVFAIANAVAGETYLAMIRDLGAARTSFLATVVKALNVACSYAMSGKLPSPLSALGMAATFAAVAYTALHKQQATEQDIEQKGDGEDRVIQDGEEHASVDSDANSALSEDDSGSNEEASETDSDQDEKKKNGTNIDSRSDADGSLQTQDGEGGAVSVSAEMSLVSGGVATDAVDDAADVAAPSPSTIARSSSHASAAGRGSVRASPPVSRPGSNIRRRDSSSSASASAAAVRAVRSPARVSFVAVPTVTSEGEDDQHEAGPSPVRRESQAESQFPLRRSSSSSKGRMSASGLAEIDEAVDAHLQLEREAVEQTTATSAAAGDEGSAAGRLPAMLEEREKYDSAAEGVVDLTDDGDEDEVPAAGISSAAASATATAAVAVTAVGTSASQSTEADSAVPAADLRRRVILTAEKAPDSAAASPSPARPAPAPFLFALGRSISSGAALTGRSTSAGSASTSTGTGASGTGAGRGNSVGLPPRAPVYRRYSADEADEMDLALSEAALDSYQGEEEADGSTGAKTREGAGAGVNGDTGMGVAFKHRSKATLRSRKGGTRHSLPLSQTGQNRAGEEHHHAGAFGHRRLPSALLLQLRHDASRALSHLTTAVTGLERPTPVLDLLSPLSANALSSPDSISRVSSTGSRGGGVGPKTPPTSPVATAGAGTAARAASAPKSRPAGPAAVSSNAWNATASGPARAAGQTAEGIASSVQAAVRSDSRDSNGEVGGAAAGLPTSARDKK